jgi:hypothetical protein
MTRSILRQWQAVSLVAMAVLMFAGARDVGAADPTLVDTGHATDGMTVSGDKLVAVDFKANRVFSVLPVLPGGFTLKTYAVPTPNAGLGGIISGGRDTVFFTETNVMKLGQLNLTTSSFTEYALPTSFTGSLGGPLTKGRDGNVYFVTNNQVTNTAQLGRLTPGTATFEGWNFPFNSQFVDIKGGPDGNIFATNTWGNELDQIDPVKLVVTRYLMSGDGFGPFGGWIAEDCSGPLWFTYSYYLAALTNGLITLYDVPAFGVMPFRIALDRSGNPWSTLRGMGGQSSIVRLNAATIPSGTPTFDFLGPYAGELGAILPLRQPWTMPAPLTRSSYLNAPVPFSCPTQPLWVQSSMSGGPNQLNTTTGPAPSQCPPDQGRGVGLIQTSIPFSLRYGF